MGDGKRNSMKGCRFGCRLNLLITGKKELEVVVYGGLDAEKMVLRWLEVVVHKRDESGLLGVANGMNLVMGLS
ncbi:hypothetical protein MKW98_011241 [Papaver atlanticum]|uniref:Uncharacterized protein n=1 Tax=Papaver atlanticum TaxID=357466 RepID=A0AAD4SUX6_9MAGN|nr:hypothetical protein MKW98_011241 [Papaver atlanticum]